MSMHKADIEIGRRAYLEAMRLFGNASDAGRELGVERQMPYRWYRGMVPTGGTLAKMAWAGADIDYILTGRKQNGKSG